MGRRRSLSRIHHVGYVSARRLGGPNDLPRDYVLATVGGGSDGFAVLSTFVEALRLEPLYPALVVTGPLMPRADVEIGEARRRARRPGLAVQAEPRCSDRARAGCRVHGGYNTVAEVMRARTPALLVPRVTPISEQLVRARELSRRGLQDVLHPSDLSAPTMRAALDRLLDRPRPPFEEEYFLGTERTAELLAGLVGANGREPSERPAA